MRISFVLLFVVTFATPAAADSDLVIVGPAPTGKTDVRAVKEALAKAAIAPIAERAFDATCASDPGCLVKVGTELHAGRLLAVTVADSSGGKLAIGLALVDVIGKELVALRDVAIDGRKVAKELAPAVNKFMAEAPLERAKVLFVDGNQHYNLGEFAQALEFYKRAYRIKPFPAFQFNIAQCHRKLGQFKDAIAMYQAYLVGVPDAPNKKDVEGLIADSRAGLEKQEREAAEKAVLDARRESERLAADQKRAEELRKVKEAEALAAVEQRKAEQARIVAEREQAARYNRHPARKWTLVTGGLGAAAIITGGVFAVSARNAQASFDDAGCGDPAQGLVEPVLARCRADLDRGDRDSLLANAFLIGGGAVLAGSVLVFVLDPGNLERPAGGKERRAGTAPARAHVAVTPGSVRLVVQW